MRISDWSSDVCSSDLWLSWNDGHWAPAVGPFYFEHIVKSTFKIGAPDREALKPALAELNRYAKVLDAHLHGRTYVALDRLTIADFQLARSEEHTSELKSLMRNSYACFCFTKKSTHISLKTNRRTIVIS